MALTKIEAYEVLYSANTFSPRIWLKANSAISDKSFSSPMAPFYRRQSGERAGVFVLSPG